VFGKKPTDDEDESLAHEWNRKLPHGPVRASKMRKMEATASRWARADLKVAASMPAAFHYVLANKRG
jgi:hypothetical protein